MAQVNHRPYYDMARALDPEIDRDIHLHGEFVYSNKEVSRYNGQLIGQVDCVARLQVESKIPYEDPPFFFVC